MSFPAPLAALPLHASTGTELGLRPFQRVTAQVMSVTGTTAIISIDGYPVVAQLTSPEQATALLSQHTVQFIVTKLADQVITLKFVNKNNQPQSSLTGAVISGPELAVRLLEQNNLPPTVNNLMMARSVLKQHLPLTPGLLNEMLGALSDYGVWGNAEAELAAAMKAVGLPVTAQSLALAFRQTAQIGDSLAGLIALLKDAAGNSLPADLLQQLKTNLQLLDDLVLRSDGDASQLAKQLKEVVKMLGRSVESVLLEQSQNFGMPLPEKSLISLMKLQQMLEQTQKGEIAGRIDKFLGDFRHQQLMNIKPDSASGREEWSEIGLIVQNPIKEASEKFSSARLRIARESGSDSDEINPLYSRLILQVDLKPGETIEVDLSLAGKQVRTTVTAPDPNWCEQAQSELPSLQEALGSLGFILEAARVNEGNPQPAGGLVMVAGNPTLMSVDIEA